MQLKLRHSDIAALFGTPTQDCEYAEAVSAFTDKGWSERDARKHVDAAIAAGAYAKSNEIENPKPARVREEWKEKQL